VAPFAFLASSSKQQLAIWQMKPVGFSGHEKEEVSI